MPMQIPVATRRYSDYIQYPDRAETAAQDITPTESYGNFGLAVAVIQVIEDHQSPSGVSR